MCDVVMLGLMESSKEGWISGSAGKAWGCDRFWRMSMEDKGRYGEGWLMGIVEGSWAEEVIVSLRKEDVGDGVMAYAKREVKIRRLQQ